jgi:hypothetical protein
MHHTRDCLSPNNSTIPSSDAVAGCVQNMATEFNFVFISLFHFLKNSQTAFVHLENQMLLRECLNAGGKRDRFFFSFFPSSSTVEAVVRRSSDGMGN